MRNLEYLLRTLTELIDLAFDAHFFNGIFDTFNINHALVCERMEEIVSFDRFLASLLVAKYEIYPFVQVIRYVLRLKSLSIDFQVKLRIFFCPKRHLYISNSLLILPDSQIEVLVIFQKRGVIKIELRD